MRAYKNIYIIKYSGLLSFMCVLILMTNFQHSLANNMTYTICGYSQSDLNIIGAELRKKFVGSILDKDLIVPDDEKWNFSEEKIYKSLFLNGKIQNNDKNISHLNIYKKCEIGNNENYNYYNISILIENKTITDLQFSISYEDKNFSTRGEPLNAARYYNQKWLDLAINSLLNNKNIKSEEWENILSEGGFIKHKSCIKDEKLLLIYFLPPYEKGSVADRIGFNAIPDVKPTVNLTFDIKNDQLISATKNSSCVLDRNLYNKQFIQAYNKLRSE